MFLALSTVLMCVCRETIGDSRRTRGSRDALSAPASVSAISLEAVSEMNMGVSPNWSRHPDTSIKLFSKSKNASLGSYINENMTTPKLQKDSSGKNDISSPNTHGGNTHTTTVINGRPSRLQGQTGWNIDIGGAPMCAFRMMEGGIGGQLCFRYTQFGFRCQHKDCRTVRSPEGSLMASVMTNGSVLLQWTYGGPTAEVQRKTNENMAGHVTDKQETGTKHPKVKRLSGASDRKSMASQQRRALTGQQAPKTGFELSCWWNGSYTQFECASVHLGSGCRDFLLSELHENVPYRICLHPLVSATLSSGPAQRRDQGDCVEFTISPSGMQDIVIAMTTVGGAICVMLVIICLLVAYITENIMSPTTQHTHSTYQTHTRH